MESVIVTREEAEHFLSIQKYNFGYDYDYIYGDVSGYGYDEGSGYGYGPGCGGSSENGYGYGSTEYGYGPVDYGYGSGDGTGYDYKLGYGYGYGFGFGDIKALNGNIVDCIDDVPTIITQVRGNIACGYIVKNNLTLVPCYIAKVGNSFAHGKTLKEAVADAKAKKIKKLPIEERIEKFKEVFGSLDSEHTGKKFYDWHHFLTGSCKMGRDGFCKSHDIDLEKKYTVKYFLDITENTYGGDIIKLIREAYETV